MDNTLPGLTSMTGSCVPIKILSEVRGRIRDIKIAGDGSIYILSQTSGLHRLYRKSAELQEVENQEELASISFPSPHPGKKYYELVCSGCHDTGASGSPVLGDYGSPSWISQEHSPDNEY